MRKAGAVVNDVNAPMDGSEAHQRHPGANERQPPSSIAVSLEFDGGRRSASARQRRVTTAIIVVFWVVQYVYLSISFALMNPGEHRNVYLPRVFVTLAGLLISFGMLDVQKRLRESSLTFRAAVAGLMALIAPLIHSAMNMAIFSIMLPGTSATTAVDFLQDALWRFYYFVALSAIILALSYAGDIREREARISSLQALAHSAQIRALRNQLNPHFLFNALNSIAGLISAKRVGNAETMTENLADFLRLTLALDPQQLISLDEEIRLQQLYLNIEQVRFPDRLRLKVDVPEEARRALVPSLVTQPLIENSIKYGVARSTEPVELTIAATTHDDVLELVISNSGGNARLDERRGAHFGLKNVAERIRMHFGARGDFAAEPQPGGGFRNVIRIPLQVVQ
jgi:two-component sensor histidine kinase